MYQWTLGGNSGFDSLSITEAPRPLVSSHEVLLKFHAASLNYRDIMIVKGFYYWPTKPDLVPLSDGAGEIAAIGDKVTRFRVGQRVVTAFYQSFIAGAMSMEHSASALGGSIDGVLREYGVFNEQGLVSIPDNITYREAATLPCAALTAWNALYGGPRPLKPGDTVLVQGTGGVSIFALQFAVAGGAEVIAITSDFKKEVTMQDLGAHYVMNYKKVEDWGEKAKALSLDHRGADFIVEIGGPATLAQSRLASKVDGVIAIVGTRGGRDKKEEGTHTDLAMTRRVMVGDRIQLEDMMRALAVNAIKPVIDAKRFKFHEVKEAYQYLDAKKHIGKVVIDIVANND